MPFNILRHMHPRSSGMITYGGGSENTSSTDLPSFAEGGSAVAGYAAGGSTLKNPGIWGHIHNNYNGRHQAVIRNNVTGAQMASGGYYNTRAEVNAALRPVLERMNKPYAEYKIALGKQKDVDDSIDKTVTDSEVQAKDLNAAREKLQGQITQIRLEIAKLQAEDQTEPKIIETISKKNQELLKLQQDMQAVGSGQSAERRTGERALTSGVMKDPASAVTDQEVATISPTTTGTEMGTAAGKAAATTDALVKTGTAGTAADTSDITTSEMTADTSEAGVKSSLTGVDGETGTVSTSVVAATSDASEIEGLGTDSIATVDATKIIAPSARTLDQDELISGSAVDMSKVNEVTDIAAAQADPSKQATVKGQLEGLMEDFDDGSTPAWAAGAMRAATAAMAARGLGSSSMAGQAIVQAAMESALPIAQQDASTVAQFEAQNLSNRQQVAMFAAEQRSSFLKLDFDQAFQTRVINASKIGDIANINFTADQQVALENARMAQTVDLSNMTAKNAKTMADAASMAQMDLTNLSNQQQAQVENAKNFLAMDMANLNNKQQTTLFKAKAIQDAILNDTAAKNAASQFNATSENQTNQFMASLDSQTKQFNASQQNAMTQFNINEENAIAMFNKEQSNARDEFNADNALIIAQANAKWRQGVVTTNTAAQNEANMQNAKAANGFTAKALDEIWQKERDILAFAWKSAESAMDRKAGILRAQIQADGTVTAATVQNEWDAWKSFAHFL